MSSARTSLDENGSQKGRTSRTSRVKSPLPRYTPSVKESPAEEVAQATPRPAQQEMPTSPIVANIDTTPRVNVSLANGTKHVRGASSVSRKRSSVPYAFTTDDSDDYQSALDHSTNESDGVDEGNSSPTRVVHEDYSKGIPGAYTDDTPRESLERGGKVSEEGSSQRDLKAGFLGSRTRTSSVATSAATERPKY